MSKESWPSSRTLCALILLAALCAHGAYFLLDPIHVETDSITYIDPARNLASGAGYVNNHGAPEVMRTPVYPGFLSLFYAMGLDNAHIAAVQHMLMALLAAGVFMCVLAATGSKLWASAAGLIHGLDLATITMANKVMTETTFAATLFACGVIAYLAGGGGTQHYPRGGKQAWLWPLCGLLAGVAALIRPIGILLFAPLGLFAALRTRRIAPILALTLAFSLPVAGWIARNIAAYNIPTVSSIAGINMLKYRAAGAVAMEMDGEYMANFARLQDELTTQADARIQEELGLPLTQIDEATLSRGYAVIGLEILRAHPIGAVKAALYAIPFILLGNSSSYLANLTGLSEGAARILTLAYTSPLFLLVCLGGLHMYRKQRSLFWLTFLLIAYGVGLAAGSEGYSRFRIPIMPWYAIAAGAGVVQLAAFIQAWRRNRRIS